MAIGDRGPGDFNDVDPDFQGNVDLLISVASWADLVTEARGVRVYHPHDGIDNDPDAATPSAQTGPYPGGDDGGGSSVPTAPAEHAPNDNRPPDLPLAGVSTADFFGGAWRLTGQRLNDIEHMFNVVTNDWGELGSHIIADGGGDLDGFETAMQMVFSGWKGAAREECVSYVGEIVKYLEDEQTRVSGLADCLAAYAGIIKNARRSIVSLMGGFVAAMANQMSADVKAAQTADAQFKIGAAAQIVAGAVSVVLGFPIGAAGAAKSLIGIAISLTDKVLEGGVSQPPMGGGYAAIARTYLAGVEKVFQDAQVALAEKYPMLRAIQQQAKAIPHPLFTTKQFDANGHRVMVGSA